MRRSSALLALAVLAAVATAALGQAYPTRSVTLVVPTVPGGSTDFSARLLADPLSKALGQPIIVENRPGASGNIGTQAVAKAAADGHMLLVQYSGYHTGNPALFKGLQWDPVKDFAAVANLLIAPHVVTVHPGVPANTLKEFVELAKQKPGQVTYASSGNGSIQHIASEMLAQMVGVKMVHVPYKGSGPAVTDLIAGRVDMFNTTPPGAGLWGQVFQSYILLGTLDRPTHCCIVHAEALGNFLHRVIARNISGDHSLLPISSLVTIMT